MPRVVELDHRSAQPAVRLGACGGQSRQVHGRHRREDRGLLTNTALGLIEGSKSDTSDGGTQDHLVSLGVGVCLGAGLFSGQRDRYVCGSRGQFHDLAVGCEVRQGLLL